VTGRAVQGMLLTMRRPDTAVLGLFALAGALAARARWGHVGERGAPAPAPEPDGSDAALPDADGSETPGQPAARSGRAGAEVPGRPRLFLPLGGRESSVQHGSAAAEGFDRSYGLTAGTHVVGRDKQADLRLSDTTVALRHAEITVAPDGRVFVRDLGSESGVRVDGWPVSTAELFDGDRLELGHTELLFHRDPVAGQDAGREGFDRVDGA